MGWDAYKSEPSDKWMALEIWSLDEILLLIWVDEY
jgi:hypothetical protein